MRHHETTSVFGRFRADKAANLSILFGVVLIPLAVAGGMMVDFARAIDDKTAFQHALDAGVMAAAAHYVDNSDSDDAIIEGKAAFNANCRASGCDDSIEPVFTVDPGSNISATYSGSVDMAFMAIAGIDKVEMQVSSQVDLIGTYEEYHFAIDRSASFSIAADDDNKALMRAMTKPYFDAAAAAATESEFIYTYGNGCSFACHIPVDPAVEPYDDKGDQRNFYDMAVEAGIELREDVLLDALDNALDTILERITGTHADQITVGAYAFSDELETLSKPTANSTNIKTKVRKSSTTPWGSRLDLILPELVSIVGSTGDGTSKKSPRKTLVLITDGMATNYWNADMDKVDGDDFGFGAMSSSLCQPFKDNGVRVVVINVQYPRLPGEKIYDYYGAPYVNDLDPALEDCASPGFYYTADDTPEIQATLSKMAKETALSTLAFTK